MRIITRLNVGGPSIHAVLLTQGLNSDVFESILVTGQLGKDEGSMGYLTEEAGIRPIVIPSLGREINIIDDIVSFVKIFQLIASHRPDIIHTHLAKAGTLGRVAGGIVKFVLIFCNKKIKIFHTYHGHYFYGYFGSVKTRVFMHIERALALACRNIIIISRRLKDDIVKTYRIIPERKAVIIPLGFDFDKLATDGENGRRFRREVGANADEKIVGIVGRLTTIKNHDLFLRMAARCLADNTMPRIRFVVVGDGELRQKLEEKAEKLGIARKVVFTGWRRDMGEVYAGLDALMLTSINEGTPVTIIEAMAVGIPVVATAVGGIPDLFGDDTDGLPKVCRHGVMIAPGDDAGLAGGLKLVLTDRDTTAGFVGRAREFVRREYDAKRLIKDIESLYLNALLDK
jgi:glycosyltransferase involved in cell wall biosynthesis